MGIMNLNAIRVCLVTVNKKMIFSQPKILAIIYLEPSLTKEKRMFVPLVMVQVGQVRPFLQPGLCVAVPDIHIN